MRIRVAEVWRGESKRLMFGTGQRGFGQRCSVGEREANLCRVASKLMAIGAEDRFQKTTANHRSFQQR